MPRPQSKSALLEAAEHEFNQLNELISSLTLEELETTFDFSKDLKKKEAHWSRDKNLRDVLIHLYEWHQLTIRWITENLAGNRINFLPDPYNWKTYGRMNEAFFEKHQDTKLEEAQILLNNSHQKVIEMIETFDDEKLFTKKAFDWAGTSTVGSYLVSVTSSHYAWAIKKLKAHRKYVKASNQ